MSTDTLISVANIDDEAGASTDIEKHVEAEIDKCGLCTASKCCRYVTQEIDAPRTMRAFDVLLWQISHQGIEVFKEDANWFITFNTDCRHLLPNGHCGIYETRPLICREHSNDHCEYDNDPVEGFDLYFNSYEALDEYCRKRFKTWDKRFNNPRI